MANEIAKVIEQTAERFNIIAPPGMKYDAEKGFAIQILKNNSWLMQAANKNPTSLQQAITNVASIGLSLNPAEKLAYLIVRNVKFGNKYENRVFLEPSYMGLCRLATNSGSIDWIQAAAVYAGDIFVYNGPGNEITHKTGDTNEFTTDRGDIVGFYCTAKTSKGDFLTERMPLDAVMGIRDRSEAWKAFKAGKAKSGGPWQTDFIQMAKKTVVRQAFKMWPKTDFARLSEAVSLSNDNEGFEPILSEPTLRSFTTEQKAYFDQMIEQDDALGMYIFSTGFELNDASSAGASIWTGLWHSFPKGKKGKYQQAVQKLIDSGMNTANTYIDELSALCISQDETGIMQMISELKQDEINFIVGKLVPEQCLYIKNLQ